MSYRGNEGRVSGNLAQLELLDQVSEPKTPEWFREHADEEFLYYEDAIEGVKKQQPWLRNMKESDSEERRRAIEINGKAFGTTTFTRELTDKIRDILGLDDDNYTQLSIYTAVNHAADYFHGVDAFLEFDSGQGIIRVTIDASTDQKGKVKANLLVYYPESLDYKNDPKDKEKWNELIEETAQSAVLEIKREIRHNKRTQL